MKKKGLVLAMAVSILTAGSMPVTAEETGTGAILADETDAIREEDTEADAIPVEEIPAAREEAWEAYARKMEEEGLLHQEFTDRVMNYGEVKMKFTARLCKPSGEVPENGYPVYIALHGGGQDDTPYFNDSQWRMMQRYYDSHLSDAIYVTVRGVRDTWDTHFNPESYPLYDRLIRMLILEMNADPNRVYLEGFSAGGDGVYAISPRMADRFAGVNMSAGHPNGVNLTNIRNVPIQLQVGELDTDYSRNTVTVDYDDYLDELEETYGGFIHRTLVHTGNGHNFADYDQVPIPVMVDPQAWRDKGDKTSEKVDSYPPHYLENFVRDPLPEKVCFDLSTRADQRDVTSFYYLKAPFETKGLILAEYDRETNTVTLQTEDLEGDFSILLNEEMVDFTRPVTFILNEKTAELSLTPSRTVLEETTAERGDPNYQFEAEVKYSELIEAAE